MNLVTRLGAMSVIGQKIQIIKTSTRSGYVVNKFAGTVIFFTGYILFKASNNDIKAWFLLYVEFREFFTYVE